MANVVRTVAARSLRRDRITVSGEEQLIVRGDAGQLSQALAHIVQNAVDATPPDGPPVLLTLTREEGMARIDIIDRGCGMTAEFLRDGLFRPFASTKASGFGLGAHEARSLITAMGGRMTVTSREDEGTQFTLSLPLVVDNARIASPLPERPTLPDRKTG